MRSLDKIDLEILRILQEDGRITNADLAKAIKLSPPSTLQRVRQLEQAGAIRGYTAVLDAEKLGLKLTVICQVTLSLHQERAIERFVRSIEEIPEVIECYNTSGTTDYYLKILARDMKHYESLVRERLSRISGVGHINSSFVLAKHKQTMMLPL
jgi:Lrp/AsnC family leucine-responsive transcriptional regulator